MTQKQLGFQAPPQLAIAAGATSPNPGIAGVVVWSTTLAALVRWSGAQWDAVAGSSSGAPAGAAGAVQFNGAGAFGGAANVRIDGGDLLIAANPAPTTPAAGNVKIFGKTLGNARVMAAVVGPSGMDYTLQPSLWRQKIGRWNAAGNTITVPAIDGLPAMNAVGTATLRIVAATNLLTRMRRLGLVSGTAAASASSLRNAAMFTAGNSTPAVGGGFFASFRFAASDAAAVAGARMFVGMDAAAPTNVEQNARTNIFGIAQLSTDSTQLYLVFGGSAAQAAVALGTGFPIFNAAPGVTTGVPYDLTIWCPPNTSGVFSWQLDRLDTGTSTGGTVTPATAGLQTPAGTTLLAPSLYRTNNATLLAVGLDISSVYTETDF